MERIRFGRSRALGVSALMTLAVLMLGIAPASAKGATVVTGDQSAPVGTCNGQGSLATYEMSGDLVGCWYTDTFEPLHEGVNTGTFAGTEHFVGCIDTSGDGTCTTEGTGTFTTTFKFSAKFAPDASEIHGRCHHPITGTDGVFDGATGVISFHDIVEGGVVTSRYSGPISL